MSALYHNSSGMAAMK